MARSKARRNHTALRPPLPSFFPRHAALAATGGFEQHPGEADEGGYDSIEGAMTESMPLDEFMTLHGTGDNPRLLRHMGQVHR